MPGKQNWHQNTTKLIKPLTDAIRNISEKLTKTITETSIKNNEALEILIEKLLEILTDKGMIAPYLSSSLVNLFKPENKSQFRLIRDFNSTKMIVIFVQGNIPVTLYSKMSTFRDSNECFKLGRVLLKTMKNCKCNVSPSNPQDRKIFREFPEKVNFDIKNIGRPTKNYR